MVEVNWTDEAQVWLKDIYDYITVDNLAAAQQTANGILQKSRILKLHPRMGYRYDTDDAREVRILLYGHYRIAYLIKSETSIDVLGVFHGALKMERSHNPEILANPETRSVLVQPDLVCGENEIVSVHTSVSFRTGIHYDPRNRTNQHESTRKSTIFVRVVWCRFSVISWIV